MEMYKKYMFIWETQTFAEYSSVMNLFVDFSGEITTVSLHKDGVSEWYETTGIKTSGSTLIGVMHIKDKGLLQCWDTQLQSKWLKVSTKQLEKELKEIVSLQSIESAHLWTISVSGVEVGRWRES